MHKYHNSTPHVLDLVITKSPNEILDLKMLPPLGKSDHVGMALSMNVCAAVNSGSKFYYDYSKGCYNEIQDFIHSVSIVEELQSSNADVAFEFIREIIKDACDRFVPHYYIKEGSRKRR